jgi:plasmid stability protein
MKNITITIDDETHRAARIRAAELGTSVSAIVKAYLQELVDGSLAQSGVREVPMPFKHAPVASKPDGPPWLVDGKWVYTKDGKPRQPGALRGKLPEDDSWLEWDQEMLDFFEKLQTEPWDSDPEDLLEFDESQLPKS